MKTSYFGGGSGGGGGSVSSVFGRTGAVVSANGDYSSSQITNLSAVAGATVTLALNALLAAIPSVPVSSVFGRTGAVVAAVGDYNASKITNDSAVSGATVKDALDTLNGLVGGVSSVFGRSGAVVAAAGDYNSTQVNNSSAVSGATVTAALNTLNTALGSLVPTSRTITATTPIRIDGGNSADLAANRTVSVLSVTNTNSGVVPQTNGTLGQALLSAAGAGSPTWGTDFGANDLTTTGNLILGSSPATLGNIRLPNACLVYARTTVASNALLFQFTNGNGLVVGDSAFSTIINGLGLLSFRSANVVCATLNVSRLEVTSPVIQFAAATTVPGIIQADATGAGINGQRFILRSQNATGTTANGGQLDIMTGTGTSNSGLGRLIAGASNIRLQFNDTGLGLYTATPVAQAARVGQGTNSTGVVAVNRTMSDVTSAGLADPVKVNQNFANLIDNMWNPLELALHNLGATA